MQEQADETEKDVEKEAQKNAQKERKKGEIKRKRQNQTLWNQQPSTATCKVCCKMYLQGSQVSEDNVIVISPNWFVKSIEGKSSLQATGNGKEMQGASGKPFLTRATSDSIDTIQMITESAPGIIRKLPWQILWKTKRVSLQFVSLMLNCCNVTYNEDIDASIV